MDWIPCHSKKPPGKYLIWILNSSKHNIHLQNQLAGIPTSFGHEFSRKIRNFTKGEETRQSLFSYILAKQCRSPFNLTNFLGKIFQNSYFINTIFQKNSRCPNKFWTVIYQKKISANFT